MTALAFRGVVKRYGRFGPRALDGLSCQFPRGSLCGLVGPNGAGKTTAFSLVAGFLRPDEGEVDVLGEGAYDPWRCRGRVGILPQDAELGDRHTPRELLAHLGRLQGLSGRAAAAEAARVLEVLNLHDRMDARIGSLSHGMRRRVGVGTALVGDPDLVLLDEPTAGLDPAQAESLRQALTHRREGQTFVVSSHHLDELEKICDWVAMVDRGRCVRQGTLADVTGRTEIVLWRLGPGEVPFAAMCEALPGHAFVAEAGGMVQRAPVDADLDASAIAITRALVGAGIAIREVRRGVSLERRFLEDTRRPT